MQVVTTRAQLRAALALVPRPLGFIPTMGWLHDGHVSLVARARAECATVVLSNLVNPKQFGDPADFERYPRNVARDNAVCEAAGVDIVFAPTVDEVYPAGFDTRVSMGAVALPLEGAARPGHFDGVATVVALLFNLVGAERAYFGTKDYQQVAVIRRMALDLAIPTLVVPCPTVREADGLAMSSRNVRLTPAGRAAAPLVHRALAAGLGAVALGERSADAVRARMAAVLAAEPAASPEYVSVAHPDTLAELAVIDGPALLSMAVHIDGVRLIDNELAPGA